jgi:hypothetical protein
MPSFMTVKAVIDADCEMIMTLEGFPPSLAAVEVRIEARARLRRGAAFGSYSASV